MDDQCLTCAAATQIKEILKTTEHHTSDIAKIFENLKNIEVLAAQKNEKVNNTADLLREINESLKSIDTKLDNKIEKIYENMRVELEKRDDRITALEMIPAKKWEKISIQIITSLVTTIVGFLAGNFLK
ncbi:MAG: hypothetical protein H7Y18_13730 [Clostridiaceae bacterium]|nr:hypothetical protein [Clostridiaceae bacterium]